MKQQASEQQQRLQGSKHGSTALLVLCMLLFSTASVTPAPKHDASGQLLLRLARVLRQLRKLRQLRPLRSFRLLKPLKLLKLLRLLSA